MLQHEPNEALRSSQGRLTTQGREQDFLCSFNCCPPPKHDYESITVILCKIAPHTIVKYIVAQSHSIIFLFVCNTFKLEDSWSTACCCCCCCRGGCQQQGTVRAVQCVSIVHDSWSQGVDVALSGQLVREQMRVQVTFSVKDEVITTLFPCFSQQEEKCCAGSFSTR